MINLEIHAGSLREAVLTVDVEGIAGLVGQLRRGWEERTDVEFTPWGVGDAPLEELALTGPPFVPVCQWRIFNDSPSRNFLKGHSSEFCVEEFRSIHGGLCHSVSLIATEVCLREFAAWLEGLREAEAGQRVWVFGQAACYRLPRNGCERAARAVTGVLGASLGLREACDRFKAMPPVRMCVRRVAGTR